MEREEALSLIRTDVKSDEFYKLIGLSNQQSRKQFGDKGYVFAQIGMNAEPCSKNCGFCSLGSSHYSVEDRWQIGADEVIKGVQDLLKEGMNDFFLMTTADYPIKKFIEISTKVRKHLPDNVRFVAEILISKRRKSLRPLVLQVLTISNVSGKESIH
jgi:biotin synthase